MTRTVGTTVRGIRAPVVQEGDNIVEVVTESVLKAGLAEGFSLKDRDVIGITEALVARAQGNYALIKDVENEIRSKFKGDIAVVFPLLSRNRFAPILKGITASGRKIYLLLTYPADEVGNALMSMDVLDKAGLNPHTDTLTEARYREVVGEKVQHSFTGLDYVALYKDLAVNDNMEIYLTNNPRVALDLTKEILVANVHGRQRTRNILKRAGAELVLGLDELLTSPVNGSGYNPDFGLLGSNLATDQKIKLFPRDCQQVVNEVQAAIKAKTGKHVEVMVYGDGAFKDPYGKIWELADPVVSPGFTKGLQGTAHEVKLKYIADNEPGALDQEQLTEVVKNKIKQKTNDIGASAALGTTPRHLPDLLGSLCDLTSGSGDKGTPIVLVQGYFDDYTSE